MRIAIAWAVLLFLDPAFFFAQSASKPTERAHADRSAMTCAQILQMTSDEWIAKATGTADSWEQGQLRGIQSYGKCYDDRTDRLAASLERRGKGPLMGARGDFGDFMKALEDFTAQGLADSQPPGDALKKAYARLYEKQFRYQFYQSYEDQADARASPVRSAKEAASVPANPPAANVPAAGASRGVEPVSELTRAKNRFGELLDGLPSEKLHEVHAAFAKVVETEPLTNAEELAIYRYAIFVLEPSPPSPAAPANAAASPKPFAPPPF